MNITFSDKPKASKLLSINDEFITELSSFDRSSRLKTNSEVTREEFLGFVSKQVKTWTEDEIREIEEIVGNINEKLDEYSLHFPKEINLIKTTGKEEGNAAYCRSNSIIIPQLMVDAIKELERLITHELFHIFSKNNPEMREKLYDVIGFLKCPKLNFPVEFKDFKITNPDAPLNDHYIELTIENRTVKTIPVLFSNEHYDVSREGEFFDYLQFRLLSVNINEGECNPIYNGNQLVLFHPENTPNYFQRVGRNTNYVIHPEEILADNFVLMVNRRYSVPNPEILEKIKKILEFNFKI